MKRMTTTKQLEILDKLSPLATEINYNKGTNTMEVGGNLYVDGKIKSDDLIISNVGIGASDIQNDEEFYIEYDYNNDRINIINIKENVNVEIPFADNSQSIILTNNNVATLFGNQSIVGGGNIDLYVHYLSFTINSKIYYGVVYSSNNLVVDSVQDLTTIMKSDGQILALGESDNALIAYVGGIWRDVFEKGNVTAVNDNVKTI